MEQKRTRKEKTASPVLNGPFSLDDFSRNILFEDNHLLALFKPAGMIVQGDRSRNVSLLDLGKQWLKKTYQKPGNAFLGLLHRLDRPVAGVVLFAKTSKAARRLSEQFRNRTIQKTYLAVVHDTPALARGDSTLYLVRKGTRSLPCTPSTPGAQRAELSYETLWQKGGLSLMKVSLRTGRRHQIRAQLAALGCPILGDAKYGSRTKLDNGAIALQAHELTFSHPITGDRIHLTAPMPGGWPWTTVT